MSPKALLALIMRNIKAQRSGQKISNTPLDIFKMLMSQYGVTSSANTFDEAFEDFKKQAGEKGLGDKVAKLEAALPLFKGRKISGPADIMALLNEMCALMGGDVLPSEQMDDLNLMLSMM